MLFTDKQFLHHVIDNLSESECVIIAKMFKGLLHEAEDSIIEELPENEIAHHLQILEEMHNGDYHTLSEIMQEHELANIPSL